MNLPDRTEKGPGGFSPTQITIGSCLKLELGENLPQKRAHDWLSRVNSDP